MSEKDALLMETLELLEEVRAEVHDDVDDSVVEQLDEAIRMLKQAQHSKGAKLSSYDLLTILGQVVQALPAIAKLIDLLQNQ